MTVNLAIVSGGYPTRYRSHINHDLYARIHGLPFYLDSTRYEGLQTPHFHKIRAVLRVLDRHDWVLWMDDDGFFMDFEQDVRRFVGDVPDEVFFVACRSPVNPQGDWTFLSAGTFFIRNCAEGVRFLDEAFRTPKAVVNAQWRPETFGRLTPGEQAHLIHVLHRDGLLSRVILHDWPAFNARPYHWTPGAPPDLHPVVHFPGVVGDRAQAIAAFGARFGMDDSLSPPALLDRYGAAAEAPITRPGRVRRLAGGVARRLKGLWRRASARTG
ncbi:MAG: hypothetical protein ACOY4K_09235 [Pseudomonadota bacterium]